MTRSPHLRTLLFSAAGLGVLGLLALVSCAAWFRVWSVRGAFLYREMSRECDPVWRDLHYGQIRAGEDVEVLMVTTQPTSIKYSGEFWDFYYDQVHIVSM